MSIWRTKANKMKEIQIFFPNEFQSEALKEIDKAIIQNEKAFLVVMPTGTGKTYLAAQWFRLQLDKNPKARLLYVCHNQDILSQANDKEFASCLSEFNIPRGYYNKFEKNIGQVTFATVQTLIRNLDKLPHDYFDYIIVDEAHHYRAESFEKAIKHFSPKILLGLTATPYRMDGKSILDIFNKIIYNISISRGIKDGLLSKIKYYYVDNDINFSEIKYDNHGNYDEKDLNKKICIKEYDDAIIKEYTETIKQKFGKKKTICFCATVEHVYRMEKLFNDNGIKAVALAAKHYSEKGKEVTVHDSRRKHIIEKFKNGYYDIIFVRDLFNEGMDVPDADCIMMLRPTESSRIFAQQIGRGLRVSKGKDYLLALDFTGNCYKCNINYEVLNEILEMDIEKDARDRIRNNSYNSSEIIIQNLGCEVRLSKRKIDIIKESEEQIITKEKLIENYFNVKKELGRAPVCKEMNIHGKYSYAIYRTIYGFWNEFLLSIGERINTNYISEEELIENYFNVKKELGRAPVCHEMDKYGKFSHTTYLTRFGSWNEFLKKIEEKINYITEDELIENYFNVKKELNRVPLHKDMNKYGKYSCTTYTRRYGSYNKFLEKMGEKINHRKNITDEELIENYFNVKKELNRVPTRAEMARYGKFSDHTYVDRFGSWNKFLEKMEEKINHKKNITDEELIENYWELKNKYPDLTSDMVTKKNGSRFDISTYYRHFNSWNNFLKIADKKDKKNITIIEDYTPKNPLPDLKFGKSNKKSRIDTNALSGFKYNGSTDKDNIRPKIIEKIQDGDTVLMLESPELGALKEIEKQGKNPKKIIIPNNYEFDELAMALKTYNTNLNIEVINTSVLQYLVDHSEEQLNFLWLDYCGAFSYYTRDLDIVFDKDIKEMKLILTYNTFDPKKQDDSYYFTNVIGYVLKKLRGKNEILLIEDISQRYKKNMFNVGFDIKNRC